MRISFQNLPNDVMGLSKEQGLMLRLGELLEAKVLKVGPQQALLNMKGQKILADIRSELHVGDLVKVRVAGEVENKILLRILNNTATPRQNSVDQVIQNLGHRPEPETRSALAFLLKNQLPVSKEALQALLTDQKNPLGQLVEKLVSLTNQEDLKIPTSQTHTQTAKGEQLVQNQSQNQQSAQQPHGKASLVGTPTETVSSQQGQTSKGEAPLPGEGNPNGTPISPKKPSIPVTETRPGSGNSQPLPTDSSQTEVQTRGNQNKQVGQPQQQASANLTEQVARPTSESQQTTTGQPESSTLSVAQQNQGSKGTTIGNQPLTELLERLIQQHGEGKRQQTIDGQQGLQPATEGLAKPTGRQVANPAPNRIPVPLPFQQQLEQLGLALNPSKDSGQLVKQLKNFIQNLGLLPQEDGEEKATVTKRLSSLFNSSINDEQKQVVSKLFEKVLGMKMRQKEDGTLLHLEIPVLFNQPTTAQLRIRDDAPKLSPQSKEQPLSILFQLETPGLGEIKVMAVLQGDEIQCNFAAQREEVRKLIRRSLADLKGRFADLHYKVHQMQVMPWIDESETSEEPLSGQVDFRV